ncbi:MAG: threonine synthase, partial [Gemmatimonadetes bacterium]|nr:threonine synthase [Gemmatimonadota bacterium]
MDWTLHCSECDTSADPGGLPTVCPACGAPWLVRLAQRPDPGLKQELGQRPWTMWRYREWLPLLPGEEPVSLGEGATPLLRASLLERRLGMR